MENDETKTTDAEIVVDVKPDEVKVEEAEVSPEAPVEAPVNPEV